MRFRSSTAGLLGLLASLSACAAPPTNPYVPPDQPKEELATLDWGGSVWSGRRAPDVTAIDGQPVTARFLGSSTSLAPGKHTIDFAYSIYRGMYAIPSHSYIDRSLTFTAEAGHTYRVYTDCATLGSAACSSWIEDKTAEIVVAGSLPNWADQDLMMRSHDAAKLRQRAALFEEQLSSVCAGDRPASDVALFYLAGIAPLEEGDLATAYAWYHTAAARGDVDADAALAAIERDLSPEQLKRATEAAALPPAMLCPEGAQNESVEGLPPDGSGEDM